MRIALVIALLGAFPAVAAEPSPARLLVLNKNDDSLVVVDPTTRQVVARVGVGRIPHEVAASDDGKLAFVTNYGSGADPGRSLSVVDLATMTERRVDLGPLRRPHGVAVSGGKVYFTAEANKVVGRYDPAADRVDGVLGTGQDVSHMVALSKDGNALFTSNIGSNTVSLFGRSKGRDGWTQTVVPVGAGPEGFDLTPDGKELWVAHSQDGGVSIVDVASRKVVQSFDARTKRSNRLKFTPDGKTVLISDMGAGDLVVLDAASRSEKARIHLGSDVEGILIPPGGTFAYVAATADDNVAIIDLQSLTPSGRIEPGAGPDGMAWIEGR